MGFFSYINAIPFSRVFSFMMQMSFFQTFFFSCNSLSIHLTVLFDFSFRDLNWFLFRFEEGREQAKEVEVSVLANPGWKENSL
jgi:hypothetical protein